MISFHTFFGIFVIDMRQFADIINSFMNMHISNVSVILSIVVDKYL